MKYLFCLSLFISYAFSSPIKYEIETSDTKLIYYLENPKNVKYPILVAIEGSLNINHIQSVLRLHKKIAKPMLDIGIGVMSLERRGIDGEKIEKNIVHRFNFPSQRLTDHVFCIKNLLKNPTENWNGKIIFLGGSEGGPISIKLSHIFNPEACIAIVGCSDLSFKDYIWEFIKLKFKNSKLSKKSGLPSCYEDYNDWCEYMKNNPDPNKFWFGQSFLYWADALDQTEYREFLSLKCPSLIIAGSKDTACFATDRLIKKAYNNNQKITYLKIEKMAHNALDPKYKVMDKIVKFLKEKVL